MDVVSRLNDNWKPACPHLQRERLACARRECRLHSNLAVVRADGDQLQLAIVGDGRRSRGKAAIADLVESEELLLQPTARLVLLGLLAAKLEFEHRTVRNNSKREC